MTDTTQDAIDLAEKRQFDRLPLRLRRIAAQAMREGFSARPDDRVNGPAKHGRLTATNRPVARRAFP